MNHSLTTLDTHEDLNWLFSTHLKGLTDNPRIQDWNCKTALITGNEDCPTKIELFYRLPVLVTSVPRHTFLLQDDLTYKLA